MDIKCYTNKVQWELYRDYLETSADSNHTIIIKQAIYMKNSIITVCSGAVDKL